MKIFMIFFCLITLFITGCSYSRIIMPHDEISVLQKKNNNKENISLQGTWKLKTDNGVLIANLQYDKKFILDGKFTHKKHKSFKRFPIMDCYFFKVDNKQYCIGSVDIAQLIEDNNYVDVGVFCIIPAYCVFLIEKQDNNNLIIQNVSLDRDIKSINKNEIYSFNFDKIIKLIHQKKFYLDEKLVFKRL
ncbi:hypothetical protein AAEX28_04625 [Lentisphaerota bacterium WC36G]|nr:hypothetical protein LJT99_07485 [Lentisphaerae bacterium WC36]